MVASRAILRAQAQAVRQSLGPIRRNVRFASHDAQPSPAGRGFVGGVAGGIVGSTIAGLLWYQLSGARQAMQTAKDIKGYTDSAINKFKVEFQEKTPNANEALDVLRSTANKYAVFVPGGKEFVNKAFEDIDTVRKTHGQEVDKIVQDAYGELRDASKKGFSLDTASDSWGILSKYIGQLSALAVDAGHDVMNNHPELKNKLGGSFDQLKQLGAEMGPEAKKQVDETYQEIRGILNEGLQWNTVERIRQLVQEKTQSTKRIEDAAWQQGLDQIEPMLQKNPQIRKLIDENGDMIRKGNIQEAMDKVRKAVQSGDLRSLEDYILGAKERASEQSSSKK